MRFGSKQSLSTLALIAGAVIFLVAAVLGWSGAVLVAVALMGGGLFGLFSGERGQPSAGDTEAFLVGMLATRGYAGAFELRDIRHHVFTGGGNTRMLVRFSAEVVFTEPLYRATEPPAMAFEGFNPRRLSWLRKALAQLVDEGVAGAVDLRAKMPADVYQRRYVVVKSPKGAKAAISGTATTSQTPNGWVFHLEDLGGLGPIKETGEPLAAFSEPVVLDTREGDRWIRETVAAWRRFEREVMNMRERHERERADGGERALDMFYSTVKAGMVFHGEGETATRQLQPTHFFLEIVSVDRASGALGYLLRNDGAWDDARGFAAEIAFNAVEHVVELVARTGAEDAVPNGGPIVGAPGGFEMRFHFGPGVPARLTTYGGDLLLMLEEVSRDGLEAVRAQVYARRRRIAEAIQPGATYAGETGTGGEGRLTIVFVRGADRLGMMARLEINGWSGMFAVIESANRYRSGDDDLVLEPLTVLGDVRPSDPRSHDAWRRLCLSVDDEFLAGRIECGAKEMRVRLRRINRGAAPEPVENANAGESRNIAAG